MAPAPAAAKVIVYHGDARLPCRPPMRKFFDNIKTEFFVTGLVLVNMLFLLVDMVVTDDMGQCNIYGNTTEIHQCTVEVAARPFILQWTALFQWLELPRRMGNILGMRYLTIIFWVIRKRVSLSS